MVYLYFDDMRISKKKATDFFLIILIFAITGTTSVFLSAVIMNELGFERWSLGYILGYIFIILPLYHLLLLGYAFVFGRFEFFYGKIKRIVFLPKKWLDKFIVKNDATH
jgi:hypothetical protein